jgi:hypothetical protein
MGNFPNRILAGLGLYNQECRWPADVWRAHHPLGTLALTERRHVETKGALLVRGGVNGLGLQRLLDSRLRRCCRALHQQ